MKNFRPNLIQAFLLYLLMTLGGAGLIAGGIALGSSDSPHLIAWLGFGVLILGLWVGHRYVRCPHCGRSLIRLRSFQRHCPDCYKDLF